MDDAYQEIVFNQFYSKTHAAYSSTQLKLTNYHSTLITPQYSESMFIQKFTCTHGKSKERWGIYRNK